jgi:RHS repeat-associated protein
LSLFPTQSVTIEPSGKQSFVFAANARLVRAEHRADNSVAKWFYYLKDHLDSSDIIMTPEGLPVEQMLFSPYGTEREPKVLSAKWVKHLDKHQAHKPAEKTHHRFTGKYLDDDTKLYYFGARYYDPDLGRFISPDALYLDEPQKCERHPRECNLYIYSLNNPLKYIDEDGQSIWTKMLKVSIAIVRTGNVAAAFAGNIQDINMILDPNASVGERLLSAVSLASEFLPFSLGDVKYGLGVVKTSKKGDILRYTRRGRLSEAKTLKEWKLPKNTKTVKTKSGNTIPDSLTKWIVLEHKDAKRVDLTKQIRSQIEIAQKSNRTFILVVGKNTRISGKIYDKAGENLMIIRRSHLGPQ